MTDEATTTTRLPGAGAINDESRFIGEIENRVLATLIHSPALIDDVVDQLTPADFYFDSRQPDRPYTLEDVANGELRRDCFGAILRVRESGRRVNETTVRRELAAKGYDRDDVTAYFRAIRTDNVYPIFQYDVRRMARYAESRVDDSADESPAQFESATLATLVARGVGAVEYAIPGVLAERQSCLVQGQEKYLKTGQTIDALASFATCGKFLNYFPVSRRRNVLLASGENGIESLLDTCGRIFRSKGVDLATVDNFTITTELPRFASDSDLRTFEQRIRDAGAEIVAVDPAAVCMSVAAGSTLSVAYAELRAITDVCNACNATLLLVHHTTKGSNVERQGLKAAAGAGFAEWARQWWLINRIGKFNPTTGEHHLKLIAGGSAGHSGQWFVDVREGNQNDPGGRVWDVNVRPIGDGKVGRTNRTVERNADKILSEMRRIGEVESGTVLRSSMNGVAFNNAIAHLKAIGAVREREITKGGQDCVGYELTGESAQSQGAA
jgi:hypothetical protein